MSGPFVAGLLVVAALVTLAPRRERGRLAAIRGSARRPPRRRWLALPVRWADQSPRRVSLVAALAVGAAVFAWQGPVAGAMCAGYAAIGAYSLLRNRAARRGTAARAATTDAVSGLACDLRAGLAPTVALRGALPAFVPGARATLPVAADMGHPGGELAVVEQCRSDPDRGETARRLVAAWRLAERSGAPLAGVLERLDVDLRAAERARASAEAQTAGARATAFLLAALPAAGLGMGHLMGADPLHVLLHTPIGAALELTAATLQLGGLVWSSRLTQVPTWGTA